MLLTATQVIVIELPILLIYFCYKETRSGNVTKRKKEKGNLVSTRIKRQDCQNKTKSGLKVVKEKINQKFITSKKCV